MKIRMNCMLLAVLFATGAQNGYSQSPITSSEVVFEEKDGLLAVEAEHFYKQTATEVRAFYLTHKGNIPELARDGDDPHLEGASGGAYLEILPDTRRTHGDKLIRGENFSPEAGKMAVLHYKVKINTPGKYYVWVRAYSTGSEDNGLHVGLDGTWPSSGQRLQWCQGKQSWRWESKQRTEAQHCGEPYKIFLDIAEAGVHDIHFSMREDGFEFDKWLLTLDREFKRPEDAGPKTQTVGGKRPKIFLAVSAAKKESVVAQESSASEVKPNVQKVMPTQAKANATHSSEALVMSAKLFTESTLRNYYLDRDKWLAVNPAKHRSGSAARTFPYPTGIYDITISTVGENDGTSLYSVTVDGEDVGTYTNVLGNDTVEEGEKFNHTWKNVSITEGAIIGVTSVVGSENGTEFSRARWSQLAFSGANAATKSAIAPLMQAAAVAKSARAEASPSDDNHGLASTSPTENSSPDALQQPRQPHGNGAIEVTGELMQWHKVTLDLSGPYADEMDNMPNPFTDYRMTVKFLHDDGTSLSVPGYFAADGNAANTGATSGTVWRAHFAPPLAGRWKYRVYFQDGKGVALDESKARFSLSPFDSVGGEIEIAASDKTGRDLRAHGQLKYVGQRYLQFAGSKKYFLKVGADAPETLLAFADFDNTEARKAKKAPLKTWSAHVADWKDGDPAWGEGRGKGLIGAINYLSGKGCNAFSFLTYNAGGDGDNVWPFIAREDKMHYDCSKLDQWGIVFEHGTKKGMYLHFKMQETENDDHRTGLGNKGFVAECLDGGNLGDQRKLYCRELIARFGHNLALNWNLGEENTQSTEQQQAMIDYIAEVDAYGHNIVLHTYPGQQDKVYRPLLGDKSKLTGTSLQNSSLETTHAQTVKWVTESTKAGKPWVVAFDESGSAAHAQCPDLGYQGFDGRDNEGKMVYTQHKVRKETLWGHLMAGGAGNEYYFGYRFAQNDIVCEDWRSRDQSWDYCRIAINFFHENGIPFWKMVNMDELVGNPTHKVDNFCFAKADDIYLVYMPNGGSAKLDLSGAKGAFRVRWFNPRSGGDLQQGSIGSVIGGIEADLGMPPADKGEDWLVVVQRPAN